MSSATEAQRNASFAENLRCDILTMPRLAKTAQFLPTYDVVKSAFDGLWEAPQFNANVVISRRKVWLMAELMAELSMVSSTTCVLSTKQEDVRGKLDADGAAIHWSDGERWIRAGKGVAESHPSNLFDGSWEVNVGAGAPVVVAIAGVKILWHDGQVTPLNILGARECEMLLEGETYGCRLADDDAQLVWSDGDVWLRRVPPVGTEGQRTADAGENLRRAVAEESLRRSAPTAAEACAAMWDRDAARFGDLLARGLPSDLEVETEELWRHVPWTPPPQSRPPRTTLLAAAILLHWPEGVQLCVHHGADVNGAYCGPFPCADGSVACEAEGTPLLRLALCARDQAQCLICAHLLQGGVRKRTFNVVKKKAMCEMEAVTARHFTNYTGPFAQEAAPERRGRRRTDAED